MHKRKMKDIGIEYFQDSINPAHLDKFCKLLRENGYIHNSDMKEVIDVLDELCNTYIANRDTSGEFIKCITPTGIPSYWRKAKSVVKKFRVIERVNKDRSVKSE